MTPSLSFFVTGAANFVGRAVTRYLVARGHRVTGLTAGLEGANRVRADGGLPVFADPYRASEIASNLRMAQAEVVLHVAPQSANHVPHRDAVWDERALIEGTAALLDAARASGVKAIVYPSFAFLYGDTGGEWVDESAPRQAPDDSPAFAAAMKAEDLVLASDIGCVLRCGYAYGPQSDAVATLVDHLRAGRPVITGSTTAYSNWVHVDDLAQALLLAAGKQMAGEIFNVVDDAPATPADFVRQLAANMGLTASGGGLRSLLMRPGKIQAALLRNSVRVRNGKAKQELGWTSTYPTVEQGLDQVLLLWRAGQMAPA